jgi:uncharacterized protein (DUF58 family)
MPGVDPTAGGPVVAIEAGRRGYGARPTRWAAVGVALVAVATLAFPIGVVVPCLALAALIGIVLVDVVVASRLRPEGTRTTVPTLALRVPVPFAVSAPAPSARSARIRQPVPPELAVEPNETAGDELVGQLMGRHRGVHRLPPAVIRTTGPIGVGSCDHRVGDGDTVTVFPDLPKARRLTAARRQGRSTDEGRIRSRLGIGTELESIRDYAPDDDVRQINWVASARVGRPMSNQYRVEENRDLVCVVDTGRLMASPVGPVTRLDVALDAVATLAVAAEDAGDRVGALAFSAAVTRQLAPRRRGAEGVVRALFDLEPTEVESDYDRAFIALGRHKRALIALFTDLVDESASRSLLAACPVLARHHAVLIASCRDPDLTAAVSDDPHDVRDVLRSAVALDILDSRHRAASLLRSMGATVVEAAPDKLGAACVHAYLLLKQRARL